MDSRRKIACIIYTIHALGGLGFGLVYLFIPHLMPYHQRYIEVPFEQLPHLTSSLFLLIYRGAGVEATVLGVVLLMLVWGPFKRGERWAWRIVGVMTLGLSTPMVVVALMVGPYTPWWGYLAMVISSIFALIITRPTLLPERA